MRIERVVTRSKHGCVITHRIESRESLGLGTGNLNDDKSKTSAARLIQRRIFTTIFPGSGRVFSGSGI